MSDLSSLADIPAGPGLAAALAQRSQLRGELNGAQLVELIVATARLVNWTESLQVSATNELAYCPPSILDQDTLRTDTRSELVPGVLEVALGWSRRWARQYDNVAYLLAELFPATHATLAEGLIDLPATRAIAEGLSVLDNAGDREEIEADTLAWLQNMRAKGRRVTTRAVAVRVETAVLKADPAAAKQRHKDRVRQRDVRYMPSVDSVADLAIYNLPADVATNIFNRIDATAKALKSAGDEHTIGQQRADIAASLLLGESRYITPDDTDDDTDSTAGAEPTPSAPAPTRARAGSAVPVRAKNILHISLTNLLGLHELGKSDPAVLGGFGPVIDEVAERVLTNHLDNPDAEFAIVVTHPQTGKPLQLHPVDARLFRGRRRDAVSSIWQTCAWPTGCSRPAEQCVIDHSHDYALGGKTAVINGDPLCGPHNREKTKNGWRQERHSHDLIIWISPFGQRIPVPAPTYATPEPKPEPEPEPPDPGRLSSLTRDLRGKSRSQHPRHLRAPTQCAVASDAAQP